MLRRLHLEEASRALHLRAPKKDGENQENQGESELALEFSRLLDQVQGPIAAAHDEVMALGLALAQAIPFVQQAKQDVRERAANDQGQEQQDDGSDQNFDATVDDEGSFDSGPRLVLDSRDDREAQSANKGPAGSARSFEEDVEQDDAASEKLVAAALDLGPEILSDGVEDADLSQVTVQAASTLQADTFEETDTQVVVAQLVDSGGLQEQQVAQETVEVAAIVQKAVVVEKHDESSTSDSEDGADSLPRLK